MNKSKYSNMKRALFIAVIALVGAWMFLDGSQGAGAQGPVLKTPVAGVDKDTVFYFYTDHCPACRYMAPAVDAVKGSCDGAAEFRMVNLGKPKDAGLAGDFKVNAIPTTVLVASSGMERERFVGAISKEEFKKSVERLTGKTCPVANIQPTS